jgi:hypothetical protein
MNRNNISKFIGLLAIALTFSSCDNGGDVAPIVEVNKPTMTIDMASAVTVAEGTEIPVTFNLSAPVGHEFSLYIMLLPGSTAGGGDSDVEESYQNNAFQKTVVIPPFVTSFTTSILINEDVDVEGLEHLLLSIGDSRSTAVHFTPKNVDVSITNVVKDQLDMVFHWDRTYSAGTYSNTLCKTVCSDDPTNKTYDIDIIVYDDTYTDTGFGAYTGNCGEELSMNLADYVDGTYHLAANLWTNANIDLAETSFPFVAIPQFDIQITVDYSRAGAFNGVYTQEPDNFFNSNTPIGSTTLIVDVVISTDANGVRKFSVQNSVGTVSAYGKIAHKRLKK